MAIISNKDHVLTILPIPLLVLRSIQLATAVAILGLAAYGENYASFDGDGLILFAVCSFPFPTPYPTYLLTYIYKGYRDYYYYSLHNSIQHRNTGSI